MEAAVIVMPAVIKVNAPSMTAVIPAEFVVAVASINAAAAAQSVLMSVKFKPNVVTMFSKETEKDVSIPAQQTAAAAFNSAKVAIIPVAAVVNRSSAFVDINPKVASLNSCVAVSPAFINVSAARKLALSIRLLLSAVASSVINARLNCSVSSSAAVPNARLKFAALIAMVASIA